MIGLYRENAPLKDVVLVGCRALNKSFLQFFGCIAGMCWAVCFWCGPYSKRLERIVCTTTKETNKQTCSM